MQVKLSGNKLRSFFSPSVFLLGIPAALLFAYILIRAYLLSLTWDEAFTFFEFVRHPSWLPHDFNYMSANNHLLNTWLMKCSVFLFGDGELALRLPNVIASGFFFFWSARLLKKLFENNWFALAAFLALTLNPFVLDFFSLARGYGISLALMMGAVYQLTVYIKEDPAVKRGLKIQFFLLFAILANLTMLHLFAAVTLILLIDQFYKKENSSRKTDLIKLLILPVLLLAVLFFYLQKLESSGAFFFGREIGTAIGTLHSLAESAAYRNSNFLSPMFFVLVAFPVLLFFPLLRKWKNRTKDKNQYWSLVLLTLLLLSFLTPVLQHILLGSNYLSGRTGIFLLPLFSFAAIGLSLQLPRLWTGILLSLLGTFSILLFTFSFNLRYTIDFREQADLKDAMRELKKQNPQSPENLFALVFTTDLPYEVPVNYYKMRFNIPDFGHAVRQEELPGASWYYIPLSDSKKYKDIQPVRIFPETRTGLFRSNPFFQFKKMLEGWEDFDYHSPDPPIGIGPPFFGRQGTFAGGEIQFSTLSRLEQIDTLSKRPLAATISCRLSSSTKNTAALLAFVIITDTSESFQYMHFSQLAEKPGEWSITGWTRPLPVNTKEVRVFIWNPSDALVYMDNVTIRLIGRNDQ